MNITLVSITVTELFVRSYFMDVFLSTKTKKNCLSASALKQMHIYDSKLKHIIEGDPVITCEKHNCDAYGSRFNVSQQSPLVTQTCAKCKNSL